ncbi:S-formylglutathione hydrolase [Aliidongia dinghuensis]|uniref:S-formylglutathione hydrolase n=1 Tax=Aliidongia dinghuensis TaxID=1867774 RepID=A0A8J2YP82_9PROT|nr:S-formylglutathione hydrolase [Aliidongia dinghuensis]GGF01424.1 S-formylglutathione hydrolase [Aliidongia dinghuensis]
MTLSTRSEQRCFGGRMGFYTHRSEATGTDMAFAVYLPPQAARGPVPALYYLAGLTCTEETFAIKAGAQRVAAGHGLALVACDTSPRGANLPGEDDSWDFGTGAGFYLDATAEPWSRHYRMATYVNRELPALVEANFPVRPGRRGIFGHSMGGHGALVSALRQPALWQSVSAFAPITNPVAVPWGEKAFSYYLGPDRARWAEWDASLLMAKRPYPGPILVDQGLSDQFLEIQLRPERLEEAAALSGQELTLRRHEDYDHSYWFIQSFVADHVAHHARLLL